MSIGGGIRTVFRALSALLITTCAPAATLGTVTQVVGGVADLVLDQARQRLYLVGVPNKVIVYSIAQRRVLQEIRTSELPLAAAMSRSGKFLYVAAHNASTLDVIDLDTLSGVTSVSLPARPEAVAVGFDERVLITTIGTGANNAQEVLLLYDPSSAVATIRSIAVAPPAPQPPILPAPQGQFQRANRSFVQASPDGRTIIGVNYPNANQRVVFVFDVPSASVLRSRAVANVSNVLSVSPDGRRFMAGLTLFDTETLEVLAQQNLANSPYPIPTGTNFNLQTNQGGSAFSPDGSVIYSAFNVAPQQVPAARPNVSQLMVSDPENLLIRLGLQLEQNLAGKLIASPDGQNLFGISESGFMQVPIGTLNQQPLAGVAATSVLLANDQCGVFGNQRARTIQVTNLGRGSLGATSASLIQATNNNVIPGLGGPGGPGGGVVVIPGPGGPITIPIGNGGPTGPVATGNSPLLQQRPSAAGVDLTFTFNAANRNVVGTVNPLHEYLVQSTGAVNIPASIRVMQNNRDSDARGEIIPIETGISTAEGLTDMFFDAQRQRIYIPNSGKNQIEVFDVRQRRLIEPIRAGQLPRSVAVTLDNAQMFVANSGGESLTVVDLESRRPVGRVRFPPLPFNSAVGLITPSQVVMTASGPLVLMNNGTLWKVIGNDLVPRRLEPEIFGAATTIPAPRSMSASPNGEFAIIFSASTATAYLYSALDDRFVQSRQITTPAELNGFIGAIAAGPRGSYFVVNSTLLNSALTPVTTATVPGTSVPRPGTTPGLANLPVASIIPLSATSFARYTQPYRQAANAPVAEAGAVEIVDANTGNTIRRATTLEAPLTVPIGNGRVAVDSRTMAVDATGTTAYVLTASGLSIVPLDAAPVADRPVPNNGGIVSLASYVPAFAPGALISIFGRNLGRDEVASGPPYPTTLGGTCVTLNNTPIPLIAVTGGQINAQLPVDLTFSGNNPLRLPLQVRSVERRASAPATQITIARVAPAIIVNNGQSAIIDSQTGALVTRENPATRDRWLTIFGTGFGVGFKSGRLTTGANTPSVLTLCEGTEDCDDSVEVFFGDPRMSQARMDVRWAGAVPGFIGLYQINLYVPWYRMRGDALPVTVRVNGVNSQREGPAVPTIAVD